MRKFSALALSIIMIFSFSACKNGDDSQGANNSSANSITSTVTGPSVFDANPNANKTTSENSSSNSTPNSNTPSSTPESSQASISFSSTSSVKTPSSKPASSSVENNDTQTPDNRLIISCWGDSLTEGMSVPVTDNYPAILNNYAGKSKYKVLNGGDGGEDTITIMARQGAVKIFTSNKITFKKGEAEVKIGDGKGNGFETANGEVIRLTAALGREMPVNDITIGSNKYQIVLKNFDWTDRSCEAYLKRTTNTNKAVTIAKGTEAKFASATIAKTNHCDVYLMGANDGYNNDVDTLIKQYKKMIEYRGNDNYIVIIPYWTARTYTKAFIDAFGDKAVDFRAVATDQKVLERELYITLTETDKQYIAESKQQIPPCLRLNESLDDVHLNQKGYLLLGKTVAKRGKELGYW